MTKINQFEKIEFYLLYLRHGFGCVSIESTKNLVKTIYADKYNIKLHAIIQKKCMDIMNMNKQ